MAKTSLFVVSMLVGLLMAGAPAEAQSPDAVGIRAQGMAGAFTAVADDSSAGWWNPAGLASGAYFSAIIEGGDDHHAGVSVGYPALGLSYYRLRIKQIQSLTSTAASPAGRQDPGTVEVRLRAVDASQFGATVGQSIGSHLVVASTLKLVRGVGATSGGLDLGAMAVFGAARLGLTVRDTTEPTLGEGPDALTLRRQVRAGVALGSRRGSPTSFTVAVDGDVTKVDVASGEERRLAVGTEVWMASRRLGGRAGLSWSTVGDRRTAGSLGASVAIRARTYFDVQVTRSGTDEAHRSVGAALRTIF